VNAPVAHAPPPAGRATASGRDYVAVAVAGQLFGLPIDRVHEVFLASAVTSVPLAPREVLGLLNLRGRVITAVCLRRRLGLADPESPSGIAVGVEHGGESYALFVDEIGDVLGLAPDTREPNPVHMDPQWIQLSLGVHRLAGRLLVILDVDAVLALGAGAIARRDLTKESIS
jgi:purine-binding chemotaxis protein CheW